MLISIATMDFKLCHQLREKLTANGFTIEQILPGEKPSKGSILVVTTEEEVQNTEMNYKNPVILSKIETLNVSRAQSKIMLGIEGKRIWESLILGIDPGLTIGVAVITDGCLRATLETRDMREAIKYVLAAIETNPAKMVIIRMGSTGGYRRVLLLNDLLNVKPEFVSIEVVDELQTTPSTCQDVKNGLKENVRDGIQLDAGKDAVAAMEIAFRIGESVKSPENWKPSVGEIKAIQTLSRQYSKGKVTVSKELANKVARGSITLEEAIRMQKDENKNKESLKS